MKNVARHYGIAIGLAILLALFIRAFIIEAYRIPVSAMRPTLESGDTVFATKWDYGIRLPLSGKKIFTGKLPHHGELVLFAHPDEPEID
ncbi:MAG: signal peptidase I, partial [Deltaproteobacteria bacterium]|nr:signal peptidase I [Deltaproteobacteria bacterium]